MRHASEPRPILPSDITQSLGPSRTEPEELAPGGAGVPSERVKGVARRWERVHEVVQAALDRGRGERDEFLRHVGHHDPTLGREIASLLEAADRPGRFDVLVDRFVAPENTSAELPPAIGPYRPIRALGNGGMGTVFLAERADGSFRQRVAVKLLPLGTPPHLHARFLAERQILARLRHPNIARLLDGGSTADGRPYLVMDYVDGEPITTFCDRHQLKLSERLRLFLEVCAAVRYAHANLVVHRDIKPSNVLVVSGAKGRDEPRVKLLDFGIAKLLDDAGLPTEAPRTRAGLRLMTPEFAAPEQVRGEPVTTAADVYQLGALLYELVAGRRYCRVSGPGLYEIERAVCHDEPQPPSAPLRTRDPHRSDSEDAVARARSTTSSRLRRALVGDVDTIVLRALRKEPDRRYPSVDALAADIRRHLDGLPVRARRDTFTYRAVKFVRRRRRAVALATAAVLVVAAAATHAAASARQAAIERDRAERAADFMIDLIEDLEPVQAPGEAVLAIEMLERGAARVRSELSDQPLLQARLLDVLGTVYQLRGHFDEAEPLLREALAIRAANLEPGHLDVASSQYTLANLLGEVDRAVEAEPYLVAAAETYRRRLGPESPLVARTQIDLGLARRAAGDLASAAELLENAVRMLRLQPSADSMDLSTAVLYLGKVHVETGEPTAGEPLLREALQLRRAIFGDVHPTVANSLDGLGDAMSARGDHVAAERYYRDALALREQIFPDHHADIGVGLLKLGIALKAQNRPAEAEARLTEAIRILRSTFGDRHSLVRMGVATLDSLRVTR